MTNPFSLRDVISSAGALAGAATGRWTFGGPRSICLDTTVACNADCIMCWTHSPLLGKRRQEPPQEGKGNGPGRQHMDWPILETILRECAAMGTSMVLMGETGEPTLHPDFERSMDIMGKLGMVPLVMTNGLTASPSRVEDWSRRRAHFRFSLHAGDVETWLRIHPSSTAAQFERVTGAIETLTRSKTARVSLINVIQKANFRSVREMVEHAREMGVRQVRFAAVRAPRDMTNVVLCPEEEHGLRAEMQHCRQLADRYGIRTNLRDYIETNQSTFSGIPQTLALVQQVPCYIGWVTTMFDVDGNMIPCEASELVMGRAGEDRLVKVWRSEQYRAYRRQGALMPKTGKLVEGCQCAHCVFHHNNLRVHRLLGRRWMRTVLPQQEMGHEAQHNDTHETEVGNGYLRRTHIESVES